MSDSVEVTFDKRAELTEVVEETTKVLKKIKDIFKSKKLKELVKKGLMHW